MIAFDGVSLRNPAPVALCNETVLLSVQTTSETGFRVQFTCCTRDYSDIGNWMSAD